MEALKRVLANDARIAYALVFGSAARGTAHARSDVDVAIGLPEGPRLTALELGDLVSRLEAAAGCPVDVVDLEGAPPGLAYRIFRDGQVLVEKDRPRLVARRARAILEYLDFQPVEEQFARGVLAAASRGR
jgi:predicted nucleotidyltransferase